jgi:hypothetical protein
MSSAHDKSDALSKFHAGIKATVVELLGERDKHGRRWTNTSIAKAGGLSRNQLYAWMGQGPQRLKQLPDRDRVLAFYRGVGKPWRQLFQEVGWEAPPGARVLEFPTEAPEKPQPDLDLRIRRIEIRLSQEPPAEERRDLELRLVRTRRARDAQRLANELIAELETELDRTMDEGS